MNQENYDSVVSDMRLKVRAGVGLHSSRAGAWREIIISTSCQFLALALGSGRAGWAGHCSACTPPLLAHPQNGLLFGLPIVLDTDSEDLQPGDKVLLTYQGQDLAAVTIDSKWVPNKPLECLKCYGTSSLEHPAVQMVAMERGKYYMGGKVEGLTLPQR